MFKQIGRSLSTVSSATLDNGHPPRMEVDQPLPAYGTAERSGETATREEGAGLGWAGPVCSSRTHSSDNRSSSHGEQGGISE